MPPLEPSRERYPNPIARYAAATRPAFLSVTLVACLVGIASAHAGGAALNLLHALLMILVALLVHAAGNVINDYFDHANGADAANTGRLFPFTGGSRFIQNGVIPAGHMGLFALGLLVLAFPAGLWLAASQPGVLLIGLGGVLLAWAYSAPPFKLVSRGLGEAVIVACWLLVVIAADHVQRGEFAWTPVAAGLSYALLVANVLFINQFPDHEGDAAAGKRTLVVSLGPESAKWGYFVIALVAHGWLVVQIERNALPQVSGLALLTLIMSLTAARELRDHASKPTELARAIKLTIGAALLHGLLLAATMAFNWRA